MLENLKPISNQVLVEITTPNDRVRLQNGQELYLDLSFDQFAHSVTEGVVVAVPEKLNCGKSSGMLRYQIDQDLKVGDIVIFHYLCYSNAVNSVEGVPSGKLFIEDGRVFLFVSYDSIYLAKRKSPIQYNLAKNMSDREMMLNQLVLDDENKIAYQVVVTNGYIIFEGIEDVVRSKYIIIPDNAKRDIKQGVVKFIGGRIKKYFIPEAPGDHDDIKVGDIICLPKVGDIPLQYDMHRTFDGHKGYFRVQRNLVMAVTGNVITDIQ